VDISDPIVWSTIIQTAVITLTLVIFILSFRTQNLATREAAYQKVLDDYTDTMKMMIDNPVLGRLPQDMARITKRAGQEPQTMTPEDMIIRSYMMLLYGIFERAHLLYRKKWIDKDTWDQWALFLETISAHPTFQTVHRTSEGMFDKPFQDYVTEILNHKK
jgi:hypothetical protein